MFIIKKLIIREWVRAFISCTLVLILLMTVANLISGFLRENVSPVEVLLNYLIELPGEMGKIFPVGCLVASLFSINKLRNRNELTAIFAAGYSRTDFILNIVYSSLVVAFLQFVMTSYFHPFLRTQSANLIENSSHKFKNLKSKGLSSSTLVSGKIWFKTDKYFFSFVAFDKRKDLLNGVSVYYYDKNHRLEKKVLARSAHFLKDDQWEFKQGSVYTGLNAMSFPRLEKFEKQVFEVNEKPSDFAQLEADITTLDVKELASYISKLSNAGINTSEYEVILYDKFSSALICVIFAVMSSILIFNPNRRGASFGKNIILVFVFTILYWLISSYFMELGKNSKIPAELACFGVPVLFSLYLSYYFYQHRKLR